MPPYHIASVHSAACRTHLLISSLNLTTLDRHFCAHGPSAAILFNFRNNTAAVITVLILVYYVRSCILGGAWGWMNAGHSGLGWCVCGTGECTCACVRYEFCHLTANSNLPFDT